MITIVVSLVPGFVHLFLLLDGQLHGLQVGPHVVGALLDLVHGVVQFLQLVK